jgi:hypothetical protein
LSLFPFDSIKRVIHYERWTGSDLQPERWFGMVH